MNDFDKFNESVSKAKSQIFGEIDSLVKEMQDSGDVEKFYEKGTKSAAGRMRKNLQKIRKAIHHPTNRGYMKDLEIAAKEYKDKLSEK